MNVQSQKLGTFQEWALCGSIQRDRQMYCLIIKWLHWNEVYNLNLVSFPNILPKKNRTIGSLFSILNQGTKNLNSLSFLFSCVSASFCPFEICFNECIISKPTSIPIYIKLIPTHESKYNIHIFDFTAIDFHIIKRYL